MSTRSFLPLEGVRVVFNFWIILLHVYGVLISQASSAGADVSVLDDLRFSPWRSAVGGLGAQVDVFFMMSGFLVSYQILSAASRPLKSVKQDSNIPKHLIVLGLKKLFRLWPGALFSVIATYLTHDVQVYSLVEQLIQTLQLRMDVHKSPISLVVCWSNQVDVIGCLITAFCCLLVSHYIKTKNASQRWAVVFLFITILPCVYILHFYPHLSMSNISSQPNTTIPQYFSQERAAWIHDRFGTVGLVGATLNDRATGYMNYFYIPWWNRLSPFFIGLYLAITLVYETRDYIKSKPLNTLRLWKHRFLFILSIVGLLLPGIIGLQQVKMRKQALQQTEDRSQLVLPINAVDVVFSMVLRPLFASSVAYLLYRCLLPSDHPLKLHFLSSFLSWNIFQKLGVLTYSVYIIHFRIVFEVMFGLLPSTLLDSLQGSAQRGVQHVFLYSILTYVITLPIAYVMYYYIESPLHRLGGSVVKVVEGVFSGGGGGQQVAVKSAENDEQKKMK